MPLTAVGEGPCGPKKTRGYIHLVVEDFAFTGFGLGNQGVIQHIEHILADLLELELDLLSVLADGGDVLIGALGLFFLFDRRDDAPRRTACTDDVLVGNGQQVTLIYAQFTAELCTICVRAYALFQAGRIS